MAISVEIKQQADDYYFDHFGFDRDRKRIFERKTGKSVDAVELFEKIYKGVVRAMGAKLDYEAMDLHMMKLSFESPNFKHVAHVAYGKAHADAVNSFYLVG